MEHYPVHSDGSGGDMNGVAGAIDDANDGTARVIHEDAESILERFVPDLVRNGGLLCTWGRRGVNGSVRD